MKIILLFLILGLCKGSIAKSKCDENAKIRKMSFIQYCAISEDCYQYAYNDDVLNYNICKREERGLPKYLSIRTGECPTDKPPCPKI